MQEDKDGDVFLSKYLFELGGNRYARYHIDSELLKIKEWAIRGKLLLRKKIDYLENTFDELLLGKLSTIKFPHLKCLHIPSN